VVVVVDNGNHRLVLWRLGDDIVWKHLGSQGSKPGQFNCPVAVAVTSTGALVVTDQCRVQVLTVDGAVLCVLDPVALAGVGWLGEYMLGVTVCSGTDEILVADYENDRVVALTWSLSSQARLFPFFVMIFCFVLFCFVLFWFGFQFILLFDVEAVGVWYRVLPVSWRARELGAARAQRSGNSTNHWVWWPCRRGACG
jgi:hypothetical protein